MSGPCISCDQPHDGPEMACRDCRLFLATGGHIPSATISHPERADQFAQQSIAAQERIASALERIADAFDGTAQGVDISESLAGLAHAIIYGRHK